MDPIYAIEHRFKNRSLTRLRLLAEQAIKPAYVLEWFDTPNPLLGDKRPWELATTDEGYDVVEDLIGSMIYGLPT